MKNNSIKKTLTAGLLCAALIVPAFAQDAGYRPVHRSEAYIEQLSIAYNGSKSAGQSIVKGSFETRGSYEIKADKVVFDFELMSHYTEPKELKFSSGQQYEITVTNEEGKEVYRYSEGKFFTMALLSKIINPGEALKWQAEWDMVDMDGKKLTAGKYSAEIRIMVVTEEDNEKIEESRLTAVMDFALEKLEQEEMKKAAEGFLPEGAEFISPGGKEPAFTCVHIDLNNDSIKEIAAFYKEKTGIGILLLEKKGAEWKLKDQITGYGGSLDYAGFYDLDGDKLLEVLIGGEGSSRDKKLIVYKLEGNKYSELSRVDYDRLSVGELDGDGTLRVAVLTGFTSQRSSVRLQVYGFTGDSLTKEYETEFQHGEYPDAVVIGAVSKNQRGIFVEMGLGAHTGITEIVVKENGRYRSVLAHGDEYNFSQTLKPYPLFSKDINNDGIVEVGIQIAPPGADHYSMADTPWINRWYQWDGKDGLTRIMEEYTDYRNGYQFIIPESWRDKYSVDKETDENFKVNSISFIYLAENKEEAGLLTLHHIPKADWAKQELEFKKGCRSYFVLGENNADVLVAELEKDSGKLSGKNLKEYLGMLPDEESIRKGFAEYGKIP